MKIEYINLNNKKIKNCFSSVYEQFNALHHHQMIVEQKRVGSSTMQAQPKIALSKIFSSNRNYKITVGIYIKDSDKAHVHDLPEEVLKGWFAHELGHVVDYESYSNFGMISYGIKYLTSKSFKKEVEHKADEYAINHGFGHEIIEAKKYILSSPLFSEDYQNIIRTFYMPVKLVEEKLRSTES
jgi:hypothetical protein